MKSSGPKAENLQRLLEAGFNVPRFYTVPGGDINEEKSKAEFDNWMTKYNIASVAIRSSSTQEDLREKSYAGQFRTLLGVESEEFIKSLKEVLASKASRVYSTRDGVVNAIVQEFIEPDIAGVIFSVNPTTGNNEFVVNATEGRGTKVVEGEKSEQYLVDRLDNTRVTHGGDKGLLTGHQIQDLVATALKIESVFGVPQDIEWAIKNNDLYILQARPITRINHLRLWDSSNISESFPGVVLPLTYSIAKHGYMLAYKAQAYSAGLSWYELEARHRTFDAMIGIFNGRLYYNLINWYKFISLFPGSKTNQQFLDAQIATKGEAVYQSPPMQSFRFRIKFIIRVIYRAFFFKRELNDFYDRFNRFEGEMAHMPPEGDAQILMQQYSHIEQTMVPHFGRSVDNDFFVMVYHGRLKKLLAKWLPNQSFEQVNIIGSISGVMSSEQATSLYKLASALRKDQKALSLLRQSDFESLDAHLKETRLQDDVSEYIEVFGHRFAGDQKIEVKNPTLEPHGLYKLLEAYTKLDLPEINQRLENSQTASSTVEKKIEASLGPGQKMLYRLLLRRLKHHLRIREKNRLIRGKVYGYMRELFPKIGQALVDESVLKDAEDIFYLEIEEIFQLIQGSLITNDLQLRIDERQAAYKEFSKIDMPERFITAGLSSLEKIEPTREAKPALAIKFIPGLISSPGTVEGIAVVLSEPKIPDEPYDILIARHTDPGWTPLIALAKGIVVEHGGMLSHAAIITRELGIPSIIGVKDVTSLVKNGMRVRINTQASNLEILG